MASDYFQNIIHHLRIASGLYGCIRAAAAQNKTSSTDYVRYLTRPKLLDRSTLIKPKPCMPPSGNLDQVLDPVRDDAYHATLDLD